MNVLKKVVEHLIFKGDFEVIFDKGVDEKDGIYENPHNLTVLYCLIGDMEKAQERMTRVFNELKLNSQKEFSTELAYRLGLQM